MKTSLGPLSKAIVLAAVLVLSAPAFAQHGGGGGHMGGGGGHMGGGGGHMGGGGGHMGWGGHPGFGHPGFGHGGFAHGGFEHHGFVHGGFEHHGFEHGGFGHHGFDHRPFWGGGFWHGRFWPRAFCGWGCPWFLPILPAAYATFYFDGVPYYYVDDVYYTWRPDYSGYVATDPPPAAESASTDTSGGTADLYIYPKNGQTEEQTSNDRYECHKWAVAQTGFDPTHTFSDSSNSSSSRADYRRAMVACLEARGYSAK